GDRGGRAAPRVQLTDRDLAILRDLTRSYAQTVEQVARHHFGALNTAANRLAALVAAGYVRVERQRFHGRAAYMPTPAGARLAALVERERMADFVAVEGLPAGVAAAGWG